MLLRCSTITGWTEPRPENEAQPGGQGPTEVGEGLWALLRNDSSLPSTPPGGGTQPQTPVPTAQAHCLNVQTPTCKVDTSTGPLSCPTRKSSTVTVFSVRRDAPERWVNSGKARAKAQAEAKTSDRSQAICSTERAGMKAGAGTGFGPTQGAAIRRHWGSQLGQRPPYTQSGRRRTNRAAAPCLSLSHSRFHPGKKTSVTRRHLWPSKTGKQDMKGQMVDPCLGLGLRFVYKTDLREMTSCL